MSENKNFFRTSAEDFKKIPSAPVAYWLSNRAINAFISDKLNDYGNTRQGLATGDNNRFLRYWYEIGFSCMGLGIKCHDEAKSCGKKWFPCYKGGPFRKWYGNQEYVVNWADDGKEMSLFVGSVIRNPQYYFRLGLNWSSLSSGTFGMRKGTVGFLFESKGSMFFSDNDGDLDYILGVMNSSPVNFMLKVLAPTLDYHEGPVSKTPIMMVDKPQRNSIISNVNGLISLSCIDWDSYETSWDFKVNPLVAERMRDVAVGKVVSGQWIVDSGKREVDSGQWIVDSGKGEVDSGKGEVDSGQWPVDSVEGATNHSPLTTIHSSSHSPLTTNHSSPLATLYAALRRRWAAACEEMRRLEIENNRIFIEAYGLQDELTPDVPWNEITLTCNPWYRYGVRDEGLGMRNEELGMRNEELPQIGELEGRLRADTVKELVSYAVGCMMGRYSLEKPGLILADQASTIADYWEKLGKLGIKDEELGIGGGCESGRWKEEFGMAGDVLGDHALPSSASIPHSSSPIPNPPSLIPHSQSLIPHSFSPDDDGIIPVLDNDWFADDIVTRFKAFVKAAFGEKHFFENMAWIEEALGKDIRSYFTKDFYKDHLQRYQNRPIYWLFQSPKGAFRALIYMHRYKPDMVGGVLGYLRSLQTKIDNQLDVAMRIGADESKSASERVQANKDVVKYARAKKELDEYEKNVLYPLSTERIEIDLDDGVKVNYRKFGAALAKVKALEGKGE